MDGLCHRVQIRSVGSLGNSISTTDFQPTRAPRAILTVEQAIEIYHLRLKSDTAQSAGRGAAPTPGRTQAVAEHFGVSPKTVRDIWNRRSWANETRHLWAPSEKPGYRPCRRANTAEGVQSALDAASAETTGAGQADQPMGSDTADEKSKENIAEASGKAMKRGRGRPPKRPRHWDNTLPDTTTTEQSNANQQQQMFSGASHPDPPSHAPGASAHKPLPFPAFEPPIAPPSLTHLAMASPLLEPSASVTPRPLAARPPHQLPQSPPSPPAARTVSCTISQWPDLPGCIAPEHSDCGAAPPCRGRRPPAPPLPWLAGGQRSEPAATAAAAAAGRLPQPQPQQPPPPPPLAIHGPLDPTDAAVGPAARAAAPEWPPGAEAAAAETAGAREWAEWPGRAADSGAGWGRRGAGAADDPFHFDWPHW